MSREERSREECLARKRPSVEIPGLGRDKVEESKMAWSFFGMTDIFVKARHLRLVRALNLLLVVSLPIFGTQFKGPNGL